jgi:hypothetical protein
MKKFLKTIVISSTLALSATAAFADNNRVADHRGDVGPSKIMIKPARPAFETNVLDMERASGRRGTVTLDAKRGFGKQGDLFVLSSDNDVDIRFVRITYANGRSVMLRGTKSRMLDLPDGGRIRSVDVSYVNRGARGATIKLLAKAAAPQPHRGPGFDHGGFGSGNGRGRG